MSVEEVHTLILGAGPAGLAAACELSRGGLSPIVLERDKVAGGLMRSIRRGPFVVDVGRKELYSRIPDVHRLWTELLGDDYRPYAHRVGILYRGKILEVSRSARGLRRGMPWGMLLAGGLDYLCRRANPLPSKPRNLQDHRYRTHGKRFSQMLAQGFEEKFDGRKWSDLPVPQEELSQHATSFFAAVKNRLTRSLETPEPVPQWRHPAKASGQISELLDSKIVAAGGQLRYESEVTRLIASDRTIHTVNSDTPDGRVDFRPLYVVCSLPPEPLARLLSPPLEVGGDQSGSANGEVPLRSTVLVYLFLKESPRFPHVWLNVTCPTMRAGRITNYAAFHGDMVPKDQTCLCVEFFCVGAEPLLELQDDELRDLAVRECDRVRLIDPAKLFDHLVLKLPGGDAATHARDWLCESRRKLFAGFNQFENLFYVQRPGTDVATYAGLQAARAIISGDRSDFDARANPTLEEWK